MEMKKNPLLKGLTQTEINSGPSQSTKTFIIGFMLIILAKSQMFLLLGNHAFDYFEELSGDNDYVYKHLRIERYVKAGLFIPISWVLQRKKGVPASFMICASTLVYMALMPLYLKITHPVINYIIAVIRALCYSSLVVYPAVRVRISLSPEWKNFGSALLVVYFQVVSFLCFSSGNYIYPFFKKHETRFQYLLMGSYLVLSFLGCIGSYFIYDFERRKKLEDDEEKKRRLAQRNDTFSEIFSKEYHSPTKENHIYFISDSLAITKTKNIVKIYFS